MVPKTIIVFFFFFCCNCHLSKGKNPADCDLGIDLNLCIECQSNNFPVCNNTNSKSNTICNSMWKYVCNAFWRLQIVKTFSCRKLQPKLRLISKYLIGFRFNLKTFISVKKYVVHFEYDHLFSDIFESKIQQCWYYCLWIQAM